MKPADRPVTTGYGVKGDWWATGEHGGVDYGCPTGDPVYAMWGGVVTGTSWGSAYGTHVVIDHDPLPSGDPGLWAVYAHLSAKHVSTGTRVHPGQKIGSSGATGNVSGPHLHVEVQRAAHWQSGNYTNPQPWIDAQEDDMGKVWTDYSGKPGGELVVHAADGYVQLDADTDDPPFEGLELHALYINAELAWADPTRYGTIRVRYVREGGDTTGHQDYHVAPGAPEYLITATHWERGEKGIGGRWQVNVGGGISRATIGTRYQKAGSVEV